MYMESTFDWLSIWMHGAFLGLNHGAVSQNFVTEVWAPPIEKPARNKWQEGMKYSVGL
jgi:hypothetical protein